MRNLCSLVFVLMIISISLNESLTLLAFKLNQPYIADNLCVNITEPVIMCNGQCYFVTMVEKQQDREQQIPVSQQLDVVLYPPSDFPISHIRPAIIQKSMASHSDALLPRDFHTDIFHPPEEVG